MEWKLKLKKGNKTMVTTHSSNTLIRKAAASLNKSIKAHAYYAIYSGFNVKSKAQFIANVVSNKISLPAWFGQPKSKKQKLEDAHSFWDCKFTSHTHHYGEANFSFVSPNKEYGYGAILKAAEKLGEFSWAQLLLSIPHHAQRIKEAYNSWKKYGGYKVVYRNGKSHRQYVSFNSYANNYFNSYRAYFVKNRILARVNGKRGIYTLTPNGKLLLSGMKQLDTMR